MSSKGGVALTMVEVIRVRGGKINPFSTSYKSDKGK